MAKKLFKFDYDWGKAEVSFEVDLEKFTPELANETLTFFRWDYDHEEDPVTEVVKKYAMAVLSFGSQMAYPSVESIRKHFDQEGFASVDGEMGILLMKFEAFEFNENDLEMEVKDA